MNDYPNGIPPEITIRPGDRVRVRRPAYRFGRIGTVDRVEGFVHLSPGAGDGWYRSSLDGHEPATPVDPTKIRPGDEVVVRNDDGTVRTLLHDMQEHVVKAEKERDEARADVKRLAAAIQNAAGYGLTYSIDVLVLNLETMGAVRAELREALEKARQDLDAERAAPSFRPVSFQACGGLATLQLGDTTVNIAGDQVSVAQKKACLSGCHPKEAG